MVRHKEFDEATVLKRAMILFWHKGYEKTSIQDLVDHMQIHRRSIYDTFGDKQTLFLRCLQLFEEITEKKIRHQVMSSKSTKLAIRKLFEVAIYKDNNLPSGCLIVNSAVELTKHSPAIAERIDENFHKTEQLIYELLLQGKANGEITSKVDLEKLAQSIHNSFIGIRVLAKVTDDRKKLENIINSTLCLLN